MPRLLDSVTLALEGEVSLDDFTEAMVHFRGLLRALEADEPQATPLKWTVDHLASGSALAIARADVADSSTQAERADRAVRGFLDVGHTLEAAAPLTYSTKVNREAKALLRLVPSVDSIRFESAEGEAVVSELAYVESAQPDIAAAVKGRTRSHGAIRGRVQTLSSRGRLQFTLFDALSNRAVRCYLSEGYEDLMRSAWDQMAVVAGVVTRDETGRPLNVRDVRAVVVVDEPGPNDYMLARGAVRPPEGSSLPEVAIRELRDAS